MELKAVADFIFLLQFLAVVLGQDDWAVTYTTSQICATEGSTVELRCTYRRPPRINGNETVVEEAEWIKHYQDVGVRTDSGFTGRVQNHCDENSCSLRISDLRASDSADYKLRFITNRPDGGFTAEPGVTLFVTVLQVQVERTWPVLYPSWARLTCRSSCRLSDNPSFIWYQNGLEIQPQGVSIEKYFGETDSVSCAVRGSESFSPSVCVLRTTCNRVIYSDRHICAFNGSSVDISCTYSSSGRISSRFWFSPDRSLQNLGSDSQFTGRVEVIDSLRGRSTLRISDLRESDSGQYRFKFTTPGFEWVSSLPGTTLTVTALQVQVTRVSVLQSSTRAELRCLSSCSPAGPTSYVWVKNGIKNTTEQTSTYKDDFQPGDNVYCAFRGHEDSRSAPVYPSEFPSVSVSPSGEIVEGRSVNLTCSSDANPAAKHTWYKENQTKPLGSGGFHRFISIRSEDRGLYYCRSEDHHSVQLFIDVKYPPKLPSVSSSGEIVEGRSVTLTCSSDANPAANYTWYKDNEESPKASGQIFTITDFRPEHSGNYYCEAWNSRGRHNNTVHLTVTTGSWRFLVVLSVTAAVLVFILVSVLLWIRRERSLQNRAELDQSRDGSGQARTVEDVQYASVQFNRNQADALYSNVSPAAHQRRQEEEAVVYATTQLPGPAGRKQAAEEEPSVLYSTVNRRH